MSTGAALGLLCRAAVFSVALLACGPEAAAETRKQSDPVAADLKRLAPLFDKMNGILPEDLKLKQPNACPTRLAYAALQYRHSPDAFRNAFFALLVIDDYEDRADGIYNMISPAEAASEIDRAVSKHPGITDRRFQAVLGFCAFRDENLWVDSPKGRVSLARVMRGLALSGLLEGTGEDPLEIAAAIDANTAASHDAPTDTSAYDPLRNTR